MPDHTHQARASGDSPTVTTPANNFWASNTGFTPYGSTGDVAMSPTCISNAGGSQAHENRSPYLTLNFCIALLGIFPTRD
jgi:microcystin-dependent protein